MSYSNPHVVTYTIPSVNFTSATATAIKAPKGYENGRILDVGVRVTTLFTAVTTPGYVRLGTTTDADAYAELNMGTAAATDFYNTQNDTDAIIDADVTNTQIEVTFVAPTGGTPAGVGDVVIVVAWF